MFADVRRMDAFHLDLPTSYHGANPSLLMVSIGLLQMYLGQRKPLRSGLYWLTGRNILPSNGPSVFQYATLLYWLWVDIFHD